MSLALRKRDGIDGVIDFRKVSWDLLRGLSPETVAGESIQLDRTDCRMGELFEVTDRSREGEGPGEVDFHLLGNFERCLGVGTGLREATLVVSGDAGDYAGGGMTGGRLIIHGDAGDYLGQGMVDGLIHLSGDCGDDLASPGIGLRSGMRGGTILVRGSVGRRAAQRLRRGTIAIYGDAGDEGCTRMIAGTVCVLGKLGSRWAEGMKRGTLVIRDVSQRPHIAQWSSPTVRDLSFLPLLWRHWNQVESEVSGLYRELGSKLLPTPPTPQSTRVERRIGDASVRGRGELLYLLED